MTFAATLTAQRQAAGLSPYQLARAAGLDHSTVLRLEQGTRQPSRRIVGALNAALGLDRVGRARLLVAGGYVPAGAVVLIGVNAGGAGAVVVDAAAGP